MYGHIICCLHIGRITTNAWNIVLFAEIVLLHVFVVYNFFKRTRQIIQQTLADVIIRSTKTSIKHIIQGSSSGLFKP